MNIFESFDFVRPREKRGSGFVSRLLDCHGDFAGLSSSKTNTTTNVTNQQVTTQGGTGQGSVALGFGAESRNNTVTVVNNNADAGIISTVTDSLAQLATLGQS